MSISVSTRTATTRQDACVVLTPQDGDPIRLSAAEAFDLQRRILSASISLTHSARATEARSKAREVRRSAKVDAELQERDL